MATASLEQHLADYLEDGNEVCLRSLVEAGLDALPFLRTELLRDQPIIRIERVEDVLKEVLAVAFGKPIDIAIAREVALFQQSLGFLLKYKSYAVKATTPLGYSIILQNPGEGFSFQRHLQHKIEIYHILATTPGSYVFLCTYPEWLASYASPVFGSWLSGKPNPALDPFKRSVSPGDVIPVVDLGTVHTAIGCVLEEFATVSVDMVERLHDQNAGRPIPPHFTRGCSLGRIHSVNLPPTSRIFLKGEEHGHSLVERKLRGGSEVILYDSSLRASHYHFQTCDATEPQGDRLRATLLHVFDGKGEVVLTDERGSAHRISFSGGDLLMIPPTITYYFCIDTSVKCSEHRIPPKDAFLR